MAVDTKYDDLSKLRIDRSQKEPEEPPKWSQRFILGGIGVLVLLGIIALIVRLSSSSTREVQVTRATTVNSTVSGDTVLAAACLLPLSQNPSVSLSLGTRHRAAIGISEDSDAVVLVVSEEDGTISLARGGTLTRGLEPAGVLSTLRKLPG